MGSYCLYYIHGANASDTSFNYIRQNLKQKDFCANYSSINNFYVNLEEMKQQVDAIDKPIFMICHSLGGIYALHLSEYLKDRCLGAITLSTPYGGSKHASSLSMLYPWVKLYKEVSPTGKPIVNGQKIWVEQRPSNWTQIVSTKGHVPIVNEDNDGVVTIESMSYHEDMNKVRIEVNHYEVVQDPQVLKIIKDTTKLL